MSANPIILPPSLIPARMLQMAFVDPSTGVLTQQWQKYLSAFLTALRVQALLIGSHTDRASASPARPDGTLFFETDRNVYYITHSSTWVYFTGIYSVQQASLPVDLGTNDTGFLAYVNDFAHLLEWTGTGWTWAPGEEGSDFYVPFVTGPSGIGWQQCDGSTVFFLKSDGSYDNVTVPNLAGNWYRQ